jgi:predicted RND superfamily exporter protein
MSRPLRPAFSSFADSSDRWFTISIVMLALLALTAPFIAGAALAVLAVDGTTPLEWVPADFGPRREYEAFTTVFDSGDVAVVTWPGCEIGGEALERIAAAVTGPDAVRAADGAAWFEHTATGTEALAKLTAEPLALDHEEAVDRLAGMLVGPDRRTTCLVVGFTEAGMVDRRHSVAWLRDLVSRTAGIETMTVHMAGPVVDNFHIDRETADSLNHFALPAGLVVLGVTAWALRSLAYAVVVWLCSAWSVGLAFFTLHACGERMNAMLIVLPVLVLVLGVAGGIHLVNYLTAALAAGGRAGVAARAVRIGWLPCTLSAGTTAIGLASLTVSRLEPIRTFGRHAAIGVLAALVVTLLVVPGLFERWPIVTPRPRRDRDGRWAGRAATLVVRHAASIAATLLVAMAAAATGIPLVRTSVRIDTLFRADSPVIRDYDWIERTVGPLVPIEVVVRFAAGHDVRPGERLDLVQAIESRLSGVGGVSGVVSAATFLPAPSGPGLLRSATRKAVAARRLERSFTGDDAMKYVRNVTAAAETVASDPVVPEVAVSDATVSDATVSDQLVSDQLVSDQLWRVTARVPALRDIDYGDLLELVRAEIAPLVEAAGGEERGVSASCTGVMPLVHSIQHTLLGDLFRSFLAACGVILLVLVVVERSVGMAVVAMVSNVFPMVLLFGLLGWTRTPLDIGSVMTASIALGMAIDGTLHFITFFRRDRAAGGGPSRAVWAAYRHCGAALVQCTIVCGHGILVFAGSSFAPTSRFALMLVGLLVAALVGDLLLLPAILVGPLGRRFAAGPRQAMP